MEKALLYVTYFPIKCDDFLIAWLVVFWLFTCRPSLIEKCDQYRFVSFSFKVKNVMTFLWYPCFLIAFVFLFAPFVCFVAPREEGWRQTAKGGEVIFLYCFLMPGSSLRIYPFQDLLSACGEMLPLLRALNRSIKALRALNRSIKACQSSSFLADF